MGRLIVKLKICLAQPDYTSKVFAQAEAWLRTHLMTGLPEGVAATYEWSNDDVVSVRATLEWMKEQFEEADFDAVHTWIQTHLKNQLPSNGHLSYTWYVTS